MREKHPSQLPTRFGVIAFVIAGLAGCTTRPSADVVDGAAADAISDTPAAIDRQFADVQSELAACAVRCMDACVVESTDVLNCGRCGNQCVPPPNGTPFCSGGGCDFTCNPGFTRSETVCVAN